MTVLIVTRSDDSRAIEQVSAHLHARGLTTFRFDTDRFPGPVHVTTRASDTGDELCLEDEQRGRRVEGAEVSAVWYRRFAVASRPPAALERRLRDATATEARAVVRGMLAALPAFCVDPPDNVRRAGHKALQLRYAREAGLAVPRTLTTTSPEAVRRFWRECDGRVVTKVLSSFAVQDEQGREEVVFTTRLRQEDVDTLAGLELCPTTFQEEIPKERELRATIVGARVFTAAVDSAALAGAEVDWRRRGAELCDAWVPYTLPSEVESALLSVARRFGLHYGAADLIVRPDGRHVFLELNPVGEFFWLDAILPISAALAAVLAGEGRVATRRPE